MAAGARLTPRDAREAARRAAEILARDPRVRLVYLFGSATDAAARDVHDIDLAILRDPPFSLDELTRCRADLVAATSAPIDLASLDTASIALAWEVVDRGICLFAGDPDVETEFVTRARARYWDFKPYREAQWRLTGERLAERSGGP